jgi:hypothetical protein
MFPPIRPNPIIPIFMASTLARLPGRPPLPASSVCAVLRSAGA